MVKWIFYCIGILFLIIFLKSILIKPILFRKKWQAGIGYGLPAILYFLLFFLILNLEYTIRQINIQSNYVVPGKTQVSVSGAVTPISSSSKQQSSAYFLGNVNNSVGFVTPSNNSSNSQNGLINLQNDLTLLQNDVNTLQSNFGQNNANIMYTNSTDSKDKLYVDKNGKGTIIGNTSNNTYYIPGSSYYNKEMKNTRNSVYFLTTWAAESAGYKASK